MNDLPNVVILATHDMVMDFVNAMREVDEIVLSSDIAEIMSMLFMIMDEGEDNYMDELPTVIGRVNLVDFNERFKNPRVRNALVEAIIDLGESLFESVKRHKFFNDKREGDPFPFLFASLKGNDSVLHLADLNQRYHDSVPTHMNYHLNPSLFDPED